jgi:hypothetical protein
MDVAPQLDGVSVSAYTSRIGQGDAISASRSPRMTGTAGSPGSHFSAGMEPMPTDVSVVAACFHRMALACAVSEDVVVRQPPPLSRQLSSPRLNPTASPRARPSPAAASPADSTSSPLAIVCLELMSNALREVVTQVNVPAPVRRGRSHARLFREIAEVAAGISRPTVSYSTQLTLASQPLRLHHWTCLMISAAVPC